MVLASDDVVSIVDVVGIRLDVDVLGGGVGEDAAIVVETLLDWAASANVEIDEYRIMNLLIMKEKMMVTLLSILLL